MFDLREELRAVLKNLWEVKRVLDGMTDEAAILTADAIDWMEELDVQSFSFINEDDEREIKASMVRGETTKISEHLLEEILEPDVWEKITTRQVDKKKLAAAIQLGEINADEVAKVTSVEPRKPWIRFS